VFDAAKILGDYSKASGDETKVSPVLDFLERLVESRPEALGSAVSPAVLALATARKRNHGTTVERLEKILLLLAAASPATLVSGVLVKGDPRFPLNAKRVKRLGGKAKNRAHMVRAIRGAASDLRNTFVEPARTRLSPNGYKPMVDRLALVMEAIDSVVSAASRPPPPPR